MRPVTLTSARLLLSTPTLDDVDAITAICQDAEIQKWTTVPSPYDRSHSEGFITDMVVPGWSKGTMLTWAIRDRAASAEQPPLVGMVSLTSLDESAAELGYWMSPDARGRGIMAEASTLAVDYGFRPDGMNLERVEWHAYVGNFGSAAVARSVGFTFEGTLRMEGLQRGKRHDSWVAGLLRDDSRDKKPGWPTP